MQISAYDNNWDLSKTIDLTNSTERDGQVNVGWGDRSTQFQGKAGKSNRELALPTEYTASSTDDNFPYICWRPNGQYFAISYFHGKDREIRVYTRDGVFSKKSEPLPGLMGPMAWSSDGQFITTVQARDGKTAGFSPGLFVILVEKNGLKHDEIFISEYSEDEIITNLTWSEKHRYLAIAIHHLPTNTSRVMVVIRYNHKWYTKWEESGLPGKVNTILWCPLNPLRIHVMLSGNVYIKFEFERSLVTRKSRILVQDGKKLYLTNFEKSKVPPPMCAQELSLEKFSKSAAYNDSGSKVCILSEKSLKIYSIDENFGDLSSSFEIESDWCYSVQWNGETIVVLAAVSEQKENEQFFKSVNCLTGETNTFNNYGKVNAWILYRNCIFCQMNDLEMVKIDLETGEVDMLGSIRDKVTHIEVLRGETEFLICATKVDLYAINTFSMQVTLLSWNVNSFVVHQGDNGNWENCENIYLQALVESSH